MAQDTDAYLKNLPETQRAALQRLRQIISYTIPGAKETMSTNVPAFYYKGKYLVSFSAAKSHLALLVMQGDAMKSFSGELKPYDTGSRIIRFVADKPLPQELVERIVRFRQAEIDTQ
jgi:uncharacterized protein YdhG (YjbR/CyaY superfamily)